MEKMIRVQLHMLPHEKAKLQKRAEEKFKGNLSATIRSLI